MDRENNRDNHSAHLIHVLKVSNEPTTVAEHHSKQKEKSIPSQGNNNLNKKRPYSKQPSKIPNYVITILFLCAILLFGVFYTMRHMNHKSTKSDETKEEVVNTAKPEKRTSPNKQKISHERKTIENDSVKQNTKTDVVKKDTIKQNIKTDTCNKK